MAAAGPVLVGEAVASAALTDAAALPPPLLPCSGHHRVVCRGGGQRGALLHHDQGRVVSSQGGRWNKARQGRGWGCLACRRRAAPAWLSPAAPRASPPCPACPLQPDGVHRGLIGDIIKRFEARGYKLVGIKVVVPSRALAAQHYAEHEGKPFFPKLVDFLTSGAVVAMVFEVRGHAVRSRAGHPPACLVPPACRPPATCSRPPVLPSLPPSPTQGKDIVKTCVRRGQGAFAMLPPPALHASLTPPPCLPALQRPRNDRRHQPAGLHARHHPVRGRQGGTGALPCWPCHCAHHAHPCCRSGDLAIDMGRNVIHGSDSVDSAAREIALWFRADELAAYTPATAAWLYE